MSEQSSQSVLAVASDLDVHLTEFLAAPGSEERLRRFYRYHPNEKEGELLPIDDLADEFGLTAAGVTS